MEKSVNKSTTPAIFLDRDGTINIDYGYVYEIANFKFIDGVIDAMRELKAMGYALVIITNQSGISYGIFTKDQFKTLTEWMNWSLSKYGVTLDGIYYCPNHPKGLVKCYRHECKFRKPHPGMLILAKENLHIDMSLSYMVGDKLQDMQAAAAAGVGYKVLVRTGKLVTQEAKNTADWVIDSLAVLPNWIKNSKNIFYK